MSDKPLLPAVADHWDGRADTFDDEPDHGLRDPVTRAAWAERLTAWLPEPPATVADLGCGTGSLSVLLAEAGHDVVGVDLSSTMVEHATRKGEGTSARFVVGDAGNPPLSPASVDVVLVRHVVWTLPDPHAALRRWMELLRPGGRLVMVEGRWGQPDAPADPDADHGDYTPIHARLPWYGGVTPAVLTEALAPLVADVEVHDLAGDERLWGHAVHDIRFAVVARIATT